MFKVVVISPPHNRVDELELVNWLFENGLQRYHLRKPDFSEEQTELYLRNIKPQFLRKIVLHQHHDLLAKFNLAGAHIKGIHVNHPTTEKLIALKKQLQMKGMTLSASLHSFEEVMKYQSVFDYYFLSPVYDSISKENYPSQFQFEDLQEFLKGKKNTFALGGITVENAASTLELGFGGIAILGGFWEQNDKESIWLQFSQLK